MCFDLFFFFLKIPTGISHLRKDSTLSLMSTYTTLVFLSKEQHGLGTTEGSLLYETKSVSLLIQNPSINVSTVVPQRNLFGFVNTPVNF